MDKKNLKSHIKVIKIEILLKIIVSLINSFIC